MGRDLLILPYAVDRFMMSKGLLQRFVFEFIFEFIFEFRISCLAALFESIAVAMRMWFSNVGGLSDGLFAVRFPWTASTLPRRED